MRTDMLGEEVDLGDYILGIAYTGSKSLEVYQITGQTKVMWNVTKMDKHGSTDRVHKDDMKFVKVTKAQAAKAIQTTYSDEYAKAIINKHNLS